MLRPHPEDGGSMDFRNVGHLPQHHTESQPRRPRLTTVRASEVVSQSVTWIGCRTLDTPATPRGRGHTHHAAYARRTMEQNFHYTEYKAGGKRSPVDVLHCQTMFLLQMAVTQFPSSVARKCWASQSQRGTCSTCCGRQPSCVTRGAGASFNPLMVHKRSAT
jgi:hypothetical protein